MSDSKADSQQCLHRVLNNLISNALKFTEEGGVTVAVEADAGQLHVRVSDTGMGIAEDFRKHLFEDFKQASGGLARSHEGSGLGLAITKRLVDLLGGTIEVKSQPGEGSTFIVSFPRLHAGDAPHTAADEPPETEAPAAPSGMHVLLVEDNENTLALAAHVLRNDYTVEATGDFDEALALARQSVAQGRPFDLLFIDIDLGAGRGGAGRDGVKLLCHLHETPVLAQAHAVALTAYAMPGDQEQFLKAGFDAYLAKPFTKQELLECAAEAGEV